MWFLYDTQKSLSNNINTFGLEIEIRIGKQAFQY